VVAFLEIFRGLGTSEAVVQRPELPARMISSVFYANLALGTIACGAVMAVAPGMAWLYHTPRLTPVLQVLALNLFIVASGETQQGLLRRALNFRAVAVTNVGSAIASAATSFALASAGFGVWALVYGTLAGGAALTVLSWVMSSWRPAREFAF